MITNGPLVSVLIPVYNTEKYIKDSVDSIISQTYSNLEIIVVDDASTDSTYSILSSYNDPRLRLYRNETNLYIAENRNKAISYATGKYIVWQDADDISLPTRVEILVSFMESHSDVGICGSYLQSFDETGDKDIREYATNDSMLRKNIFKYSPVAQPTAIIRRDILDLVGKYNPKFPPAEDLDMSFRIGSVSKFANVPQVLLKYREHSASNTSTRMLRQIDSTLDIRKSNMNNSNYSFDISDYVAYYLTSITKLLPPFFVIKLFKISRLISRKIFK